MNYRVIVEPTAARSMREAFGWIAERGSRSAAERWFNALDKAIRSLTRYPTRCRTAIENDRFPEEIRELLRGRGRTKYRIVFTIRENSVHVLYVRHSAQDELEP
jgi:plasmid stabilization system protein ParE